MGNRAAGTVSQYRDLSGVWMALSPPGGPSLCPHFPTPQTKWVFRPQRAPQPTASQLCLSQGCAPCHPLPPQRRDMGSAPLTNCPPWLQWPRGGGSAPHEGTHMLLSTQTHPQLPHPPAAPQPQGWGMSHPSGQVSPLPAPPFHPQAKGTMFHDYIYIFFFSSLK